MEFASVLKADATGHLRTPTSAMYMESIATYNCVLDYNEQNVQRMQNIAKRNHWTVLTELGLLDIH